MEGSDIDIAVLGKEKLSLKEVLGLEMFFEDTLERPIDVLDLENEGLDLFVTVEDFNSLMLKELKKFKIGVDMKESLNILKQNHVIDEEKHIFLNEARLIRNHISHRYKEPSKEELLSFIGENINCFEEVLTTVKSYLK